MSCVVLSNLLIGLRVEARDVRAASGSKTRCAHRILQHRALFIPPAGSGDRTLCALQKR